MISDLFELRQVLLGLVEGSASSYGAAHHGHTLQLCSRVQLHVGTAWVRIVPVDSGHSTSTNTALRERRREKDILVRPVIARAIASAETDCDLRKTHDSRDRKVFAKFVQGKL
jgi:hypothetical protein